jgi:hypothetical protein
MAIANPSFKRKIAYRANNIFGIVLRTYELGLYGRRRGRRDTSAKVRRMIPRWLKRTNVYGSIGIFRIIRIQLIIFCDADVFFL